MASPFRGQPPKTQPKRQYLSQQSQPRKGSFVNAVSMITRGIHAYNQYRAQQEHTANLQRIESGEVSGLQENTRLGTFEDAVSAGFIDPSGELRGVYCGSLNGHPFYISSDAHILILGRAGSFKTKSYVEPIAYRLAQAGQSLDIPNMKVGELEEELIYGLKKIQGVKPFLFDPLSPCGSEITINPYDDLIELASKGASITDKAKTKALLFRGSVGNGNNAWIGKANIRWQWAVAPFFAEKDKDFLAPGLMADLSALSHDEMKGFFTDMKNSDACGGTVSYIAKNWLSEFPEDSEQFRWVMADIFETFSAYAKGGVLREATNTTNFDLGLSKHKSISIIWNDHEELVYGHPAFYRILTDYKIQKYAKTNGNIRCNILWDECGQYPAVESVVRAARLYRSKKVRLIIVGQDDKSFKGYHQWGGYDVFAENSIQIVLSCDGVVADRLHKKAGKHAVKIVQDGSSFGVNMTANRGSNEILVDNLPVSTIAQGLDGKAIVDTRTHGIYILDRPPIWEIADLQLYRNPEAC